MSLWFQNYCATLIIPVLAAALRWSRMLPIKLADTRIVLDDLGCPVKIIVRNDGALTHRDARLFVETLIEDHLDPIVEVLSDTFGVRCTPALVEQRRDIHGLGLDAR